MRNDASNIARCQTMPFRPLLQLLGNCAFYIDARKGKETERSVIRARYISTIWNVVYIAGSRSSSENRREMCSASKAVSAFCESFSKCQDWDAETTILEVACLLCVYKTKVRLHLRHDTRVMCFAASNTTHSIVRSLLRLINC